MQPVSRFFALASIVVAACGSPLSPRAATLKSAAEAQAGRYFGAALAAPHLSNVSDPNFHLFAMAQFSGATPENEMKWYAQSHAAIVGTEVDSS